MNITWPDGSGDQITITPASGSGNAIIEITSQINITGKERSVNVYLNGTFDNVSTSFVIYQKPASKTVSAMWLDGFPDKISDSEVEDQLENFDTFFSQNKYDYYDTIDMKGQTIYLFKNNFFNDAPAGMGVPQYVVVETIDASAYFNRTIKALGGAGRSGAVYPVLAVLDQDMEEYKNSTLLKEEMQVVDFEYI